MGSNDFFLSRLWARTIFSYLAYGLERFFRERSEQEIVLPASTLYTGREENTNVSALPTRSRTSWGGCGEKWKGNYEKSTIDISGKSMRIWGRIAPCGLYLPAIGRDTP